MGSRGVDGKPFSGERNHTPVRLGNGILIAIRRIAEYIVFDGLSATDVHARFGPERRCCVVTDREGWKTRRNTFEPH